MRSTRPPEPAATPIAVPAVHVIEPTAVYMVDQVRNVLRLRASSIRREVREGRLRVAKRCGRYYLLGAWLIEWIESGEITKV